MKTEHWEVTAELTNTAKLNWTHKSRYSNHILLLNIRINNDVAKMLQYARYFTKQLQSPG